MSTSLFVPETRGLDGDDARKTLVRAKLSKVAADAFVRFRYSDGFSFARSIAFQIVLTVIPGVIFLVALSVRLGESRFRSILSSLIESLAPGPAGDMFRQAFSQGTTAAASNTVAIVVGAVAMLIAAVTGMSQVQRGASRIYGVESDRPTLKRYGLATGLTLTTGVLLTLAFLAIAVGDSIELSTDSGTSAWTLIRWPLGLLALGVGLAALFKAAPHRTQPAMSWLMTGSALAVIGWLIVSLGLSAYLNASGTFGETYGPLAGFIGLMLWAQLSAIVILYGIAFAAQLEAFRAGEPGPLEDDQTADDGTEVNVLVVS